MASTRGVWMTSHAHDRLRTELHELLTRRHIESPEEDSGDYARNQALHSARQARIRRIYHLLSNALIGRNPPDDGIAEPGMVVTVRYDDTRQVETFLLAVREAEDSEMEVYSVQSPLGSAIAGARRATPYLPRPQRRHRGSDAAPRGPLRADGPSIRRTRGQAGARSALSCRAGNKLNGVERK